MARKKFEQLNLQDAFLFSAALEDPETCRLILELFLGYPINNITVHAEHSILLTSDFKSVDVYKRQAPYMPDIKRFPPAESEYGQGKRASAAFCILYFL